VVQEYAIDDGNLAIKEGQQFLDKKEFMSKFYYSYDYHHHHHHHHFYCCDY